MSSKNDMILKLFSKDTAIFTLHELDLRCTINISTWLSDVKPTESQTCYFLSK